MKARFNVKPDVYKTGEASLRVGIRQKLANILRRAGKSN